MENPWPQIEMVMTGRPGLPQGTPPRNKALLMAY